VKTRFPRAVKLGQEEVSQIGLGTMSMGGVYGTPDDAESLATLNDAFERGINFFDTADFYGLGQSEEVLRDFLKGKSREDIFISVKRGPMMLPGGGFGRPNGHPDFYRHQLAYDLKRLRTDYIDLYFPARVDPNVPIEEQIGVLAELKQQGFIRYVGLSETTAEIVHRAHAVHPIAAVQSEYSLWSRDYIEDKLLPTLRELGIAFVGYAPLSRGFLSGTLSDPSSESLDPKDPRRRFPRYQDDNFKKNAQLVEQLRAIAQRKGVSPSQLAIAWVLAQGDDIISLVGVRRRNHLRDSLGAVDVSLSEEDLGELNRIMPRGVAAGERYPEGVR
jgi:aryl-alcohol dehydrogenase-like predicted oxidoreductase